MHIIGFFSDPGDVGGLIDTLKNSGIERRDMIVSAYDIDKIENMEAAAEAPVSNIMADRESLGELGTFAEGAKDFDGMNGFEAASGIIVSVKCPKHKAQEVRSVMEQSGALEITVK